MIAHLFKFRRKIKMNDEQLKLIVDEIQNVKYNISHQLSRLGKIESYLKENIKSNSTQEKQQ